MPMVDMATAGTATVELTIPIESGEILTKTLDGCFVKKDANLETFVDKRIDPSADRNTFKNSEYFFYSPVNNFQGKVTKAVISYEEISKKWFTKVQKTKTCTVEKPLVITFDGHFFLCCDSRSKDLNKSKFLEEYSKEVRVNQTLDPSKSFYGLGIESYSDYKYLKFISFNMRQCPSQSNIYEIDKFNKKGESVLNKLNEAGPLLLNNNKTIVGCYRKSNHNCRIKMFGNSQDTPPPATGAGEAAGTPPPATGAGEAAGTPTPATGAGAGQADTPNPPGDNRPSDVHGDQTDRNSDNPDGIHVGVEQQVYLRDFFERDVENIKDLARFLDRRSLVIKNYEHLADLLGAPPFIKAKCKCNTEHSPTLDLLQLSEVSTLSVNALVENLRAIKQNYEADKIEMTISEDQRERLSVKEAINNYGELFEGVTSRLDAKTIYNWMKLGRKLKFQTEELDQIGLGCNPAERLLEDYVYPTLEAEKLTVGRFRQLITKIQRPTILKLLQETEEDSLCIKDVIPPHSEKMLKLCLELNTKNVGLKNWRHLAYEWGIDHKIYSQFEPNQKTSPTATEILLKEWLVSEHPRFTVNALCNLLGRIDRNDAKTFLEGKLQEYS